MKKILLPVAAFATALFFFSACGNDAPPAAQKAETTAPVTPEVEKATAEIDSASAKIEAVTNEVKQNTEAAKKALDDL